jgi:hypothetical protein
MLFHVSVEADEPCRVAQVLAELWDGIAVPYPPVDGGWIALAGDGRGSRIEVYPRGTELYEAEEGEAEIEAWPGGVGRRSATRLALGTDLAADTVLAIMAREGWPARRRRRTDSFDVIETWIEGVQMVDVLTPEMQAAQGEATTIERWMRRMREAEAAMLRR